MSEYEGFCQEVSDAIVDVRALQAAIQEHADKSTQAVRSIVDTEPLLASFVRDELLKVYGKLGLAGAVPKILVGLANVLDYVVGVSIGAMRNGYRALLDDLLPLEPTQSSQQDPAAPPCPEPKDEGTGDEDGGSVAMPS